MKVEFTILGEPQGKGRPRFSKVGNYVRTRTPDETVLYENLIRTEYQRQCGSVRFSDNEPLDMRITAYYTIPASASKKKQREMEEKVIRPTKKPDWDNIGKVIADSLNQIAYRDDAQVVDSEVRKFFSARPRVEVVIQTSEPPTLMTLYKTPETCPHCMEELALDWAHCPECGRPTDWTKEDPC